MSWAVTGSPSCQRAPGRRKKVTELRSGASHIDSARWPYSDSGSSWAFSHRRL